MLSVVVNVCVVKDCQSLRVALRTEVAKGSETGGWLDQDGRRGLRRDETARGVDVVMKGHQKRNVREDGREGLRSFQMREFRRDLESKHPLKQCRWKPGTVCARAVCDLAGQGNRPLLEKVRVGKRLKQQFAPRSGKGRGRCVWKWRDQVESVTKRAVACCQHVS